MRKHTKNLLIKHLEQLSKGYKQTLKERNFQKMAQGNPKILQEHRKMCDEVDFLILEVKELKEE